MINKERKVSHPGKHLKNAIEALNMTQNEFSIRVGMTAKTINTLINEKSNITFEVAEKLASFFNNSIDFWMNLQNNYESYLLSEKKEKQLEDDWKILQYFDKKFLKEVCNITVDSKKKEETVELIKKEFYVSSLSNLMNNKLFAFCHTARKTEFSNKETVLKNSWITLAMKKAKDIECVEYDEKKLDSIINKIRDLTVLNPDDFTPKLVELLSSVGIKYVELPYLKNSNISGVAKWDKNENNFILAVNDYSKCADRIWFTIFHELGHIKKNNKKNISISLQKNNVNDDDEKYANKFATDVLIDPKVYSEFVAKKMFDYHSIIKFSNEININKDIVIGRLEKDKHIRYGRYPKEQYRVSL